MEPFAPADAVMVYVLIGQLAVTVQALVIGPVVKEEEPEPPQPETEPMV